MKKPKFEAVLFDIDGTILDTGDFIFQAYLYSIKHHLKKKVTWKEISPTLGLSLQKCYQILTGLSEVDHLMTTHDEFQYRNLHLISSYPNTISALSALSRAGIAMGAVTNRYGDQVIRSLELTGVNRFFKTVITPLEVKKPKPDAEPVFLALKKLKVAPERAILVGDSPADIQAGRSAGCRTIGATYGYLGADLVVHKPDYLISDINEILKIILS